MPKKQDDVRTKQIRERYELQKSRSLLVLRRKSFFRATKSNGDGSVGGSVKRRAPKNREIG